MTRIKQDDFYTVVVASMTVRAFLVCSLSMGGARGDFKCVLYEFQ